MRRSAMAGLTMVTAFCFAMGAEEIDLKAGWRFKPDGANVGVKEAWYAPSYPDADWAPMQAGKRWEDQGFPDVEGYAWYRRWVEVPSSWEGKNVWFVAGAISDAGILFCNGQQVNSYGNTDTKSLASRPAIGELSRFLRFGEKNLIALQAFDWGGSGGLWWLPCLLTTDPAQLPMEAIATCYLEYGQQQLTIASDFAGLGNVRPEATLRVDVSPVAAGKPLGTRTLALPANATDGMIKFPMKEAKPGNDYRVRVAVEGPGEKPIGVATTDVTWPTEFAWSGEYKDLRVLNNFVTELLNVPAVSGDGAEHSFPNPRKGWVFLSMTGAGNPTALLDDRTDELVWRVNPESQAREAMQFLAEGRHRLRVKGGNGMRLEVRAVPEIAFCYYPASPHISAYGSYDWPYMTRYILSHVNAIVTREASSLDEFQQWRKEGRIWIANSSLPGLSSPQAPSADDVYKKWAENPVVTKPGYAGMMVDEFIEASPGHYAAWTEALKRLHENPGFAGKTFYAWCGTMWDEEPSLEMARVLMKLGHKFSWEQYLHEEPTLDEARRQFYTDTQINFGKWKAALPGVEQSMVICLGYLCAPPETQNLNPAVDYQVFLDMQFRLLATEPTYGGLFGLMEYQSNYADEESMRYAHKLFRHYCIEGKREPFNNDPYVLSHIENPDFADGLNGWKTDPAENDTIAARDMKGFSWLQGRYPRTSEGDKFCWMKRSQKKPNRVMQTIKGLDPKRLYSVKLIAADLGELGKKQETALAIDIDGAEIVKDYGFRCMFPSLYGHKVGPYSEDHPAYFTFYRLVFRPKAATAELAISDWASALEASGPGAGGPEGQETAFNFVEVQPFHAP